MGNKDFAIVDEAYPYLSRRLLTDDSPRLRAALRYMVFGTQENFDVERMIDLLQALESFNSLGFLSDTSSTAMPPSRQSQTRDALKFLFSDEGAVMRELLLDEVVKGVDCLSRDTLYQLTATLPFRLPSILRAAAPQISGSEQVVISNIRKLMAFFFINNDVSSSSFTSKPSNPAAAFATSLLSGPLATIGRRSPTTTAALLNLSSQRFEELRLLTREFGPSMAEFGLLIASRVGDRVLSRTVDYVGRLIFKD